MDEKRAGSDRRDNGGRRNGLDQRFRSSSVATDLRAISNRRDLDERRVSVERRAMSPFVVQAN